MIEIELHENLIPVKIGEYNFLMNADSIEAHIALSDFMEKNKGNRILSSEFIEECRTMINTLLGEDAYDKLFHEDDMKAYYLIIQLAEELYQRFEENATTHKMKEKKETIKKELNDVKEIVEGFTQFTKQLDYTSNKYGKKNYVAKKRRPTNKYSNQE